MFKHVADEDLVQLCLRTPEVFCNLCTLLSLDLQLEGERVLENTVLN